MIDVHHVLFPTDLSPASELAFTHARALAEAFGARLTIFHAVEIPWPIYAREGAEHDADIRARWADKARAAIDERFPTGAVPRDVVVRSDVSAPALLVDVALLELIRERRPELIVMATHGRTGLTRAFIGSVTEQVVHHGGTPVLCVRPGASSRVPYRRLVAPTDLSEASRRAFPWATVLAATFGAELAALHVPGGSKSADAAEVRRFLGPGIDQKTDVVVTPPGRPWSAIVQAAEQRQADLIVMASLGHDSVGDDILGSTTDRVLRHAPCAVLVA
jgi:nucleotide-binding universal stress UspA family protein